MPSCSSRKVWACTDPLAFPIRLFFLLGCLDSWRRAHPLPAAATQLHESPAVQSLLHELSKSSWRWAAGGATVAGISQAGSLTKLLSVEPFLGHTVSKPQQSSPILNRHCFV